MSVDTDYRTGLLAERTEAGRCRGCGGPIVGPKATKRRCQACAKDRREYDRRERGRKMRDATARHEARP